MPHAERRADGGVVQITDLQGFLGDNWQAKVSKVTGNPIYEKPVVLVIYRDDYKFLLDQVRRGATIFLTSHVLEVVERLCDRVAIINEGRIVTEGALADLRAGSESLEDVFVRVVGAERAFERLDWL